MGFWEKLKRKLKPTSDLNSLEDIAKRIGTDELTGLITAAMDVARDPTSISKVARLAEALKRIGVSV